MIRPVLEESFKSFVITLVPVYICNVVLDTVNHVSEVLNSSLIEDMVYKSALGLDFPGKSVLILAVISLVVWGGARSNVDNNGS